MNNVVKTSSSDTSILQDVRLALVQVQTQLEGMNRRFDEVFAVQVEGLGKRLGKAENRITDLEKTVVDLELSRARQSGAFYAACLIASITGSTITFIVGKFF